MSVADCGSVFEVPKVARSKSTSVHKSATKHTFTRSLPLTIVEDTFLTPTSVLDTVTR